MGKQDTFYFTHDYNVRSDSKIKLLLAKHGLTGYGLFWAIIEDLYNNANALPLHYESISYDLRTDVKLVQSVINDFDLFVINDGFFGSLSVGRRLDERSLKSKKASESANKRWAKYANALRTQYEGNAIKEKKGKEKKRKEFIPPSVFEVEQYFDEKGYSKESAHKFFEFYNIGNWSDSKGNKVNNWKQKALSVWFKPENKKAEYKKPILVR